MDYSNHRCPVCEKVFEKGDEIVVCPICGAPHHRDCYEQEMHCHFMDKHNEGFDYKSEYNTENKNEDKRETQNTSNQGAGIVACEHCGMFNVAGNKKCSGCGEPLPESKNTYEPFDRHTQEGTTPPPYGTQDPQNGQQPFGGFAYDPMGGLKAETDVGNGVTAGEAAKFVKSSSPFYTRLFHQIKVFGRSRFSFVGFLFHGGWMLYRKMYKLGSVITAIMALLMISQLFVATFYSDLILKISELAANVNIYNVNDSNTALKEFFLTLDTEDIIVSFVYFFSSICQFVVRVICGLIGNRCYYKHSIKHITSIKTEAGTKEEADTTLQTKGGVNSALATSLVVSYMILTFLPYFF